MTDRPARPEDAAAPHATYASSGVDLASEEHGLRSLLHWVNKTHAFRAGVAGAPKIDIGYFASVIDIGHGMGLAFTTDGVGTKLLVAQALGKYDTVGIDCVAMNVNDAICVGAEPISMVDCIALEEPRDDLLEAIGRGLYEGARLANVSIVGGEIAQIREMVRGERPGYAFDLTGTCVGTVPLDKILIGQDIRPGDAVIGLRSSGIHSNGMTLARRALFADGKYRVDQHVAELGRPIGEELLEPTRIYVAEAMALLRSGLRVKAFSHITSDGFLNLTRVQAEVGYVIESLPPPQPIFDVIRRAGRVEEPEMYLAYNMGIGLCVVVDPADEAAALAILAQFRSEAQRIGYVVADAERKVRVLPAGVVGVGGRFEAA